MAGIVKGVRLLNLSSCVRSVLRCRHLRTQAGFPALYIPRYSSTGSKIPNFLWRQLSSTSVLSTGPRENPAGLRGVGKDETARSRGEQMLLALDVRVQRRGRIERKDVEDLLDVFKEEGNLASHQAVMLLRCCGTFLVKESPEKRNELFQSVWEQLQNMGLVFDISHYNAGLRIQLENEIPFSVTEVLADFESKNLIPNRVTYQLFIARYCNDGDIEGARKILDYMRSQQMTINEGVFHSFIKGHMRTGDIQGAKSVLDSMREAHLEASSHTYKVLMEGFAEKGDMNNIVKTINDAEEDEVILHGRHYLDAARTLVEHGHSELLPQLLGMLPPGRINHDLMNCTYQLIVSGHDEEALEVFQLLEQIPSGDEAFSRSHASSRAFLETMILNNRPFEKVMMLHEKLKNLGLNQDDLSGLTLLALRTGAPGLALDLFQRMKEQSLPVRPHYYLPIFVTYGKHKDPEGIYSAVKHMIEVVPKDSGSGNQRDLFGPIYVNAVTKLMSLNESVDAIIDRLKVEGMSQENCNGIMVTSLITSGHLSQAAEFAQANPSTLHPGILKMRLKSGFDRSGGDWRSLLEILRLTQECQGVPMADLNGTMLSVLTKPGFIESSEVEPMIKCWLDKELSVYNKYRGEITQNLEKSDVSAATKQKLNDIYTTAEGTDLPRNLTFLPKGKTLMSKSIKELETLYEEAKERKLSTLAIEKWLLSKYAYQGERAKVEEIKGILDNRGFVYNAELLRQLGILAAHHKGDMEEAMDYKRKLESQYPEYSAYGQFSLCIAQLHLTNGNLEAALSEMQDYSSRHKKSMEAAGFEESYSLSWLGQEMMKAAAQSLGTEAAGKVMDALFDQGYIKPGTYTLLELFVRLNLEKDDMDQSLIAMEHCIKQYGRAPVYSELFRKLIEKRKKYRLQRAVDLVTGIHREMNILHSLMFAFIECGKFKQARKIVETPGLRAMMPVLKEGCDHLVKTGKVAELQQLVEMTKSLFDIDRDEMLFQLIRVYVKTKEFSKAVDVYYQFEEQNVLPRPRTLRYLAKALEGEGQKVPFDVPGNKENQKFEYQAATSQEEKAKNAVLLENIPEIVTILKESPPGESGLSAGFLTEVVRHFKGRKHKTEVKHLLYVLGMNGEVETLQQMRQLEMTNPMEKFLHQRLFIAYISSNRSDEILDHLLKNPALTVKYSTAGGQQQIIKEHPELLPKLQEVVDACTKQSAQQDTAGNLFTALYLEGRYSEADELLQKYSDLAAKLKTLGLCNEARRARNEDVLVRLVETLRPVGLRKVSTLYSYLILMKCDDGDWQGALSYFDQAKAEGLAPVDMWALPIVRLEELLKQNNQPVPWVEGSFTRPKHTVEVEPESSDDEASARS